MAVRISNTSKMARKRSDAVNNFVLSASSFIILFSFIVPRRATHYKIVLHKSHLQRMRKVNFSLWRNFISLFSTKVQIATDMLCLALFLLSYKRWSHIHKKFCSKGHAASVLHNAIKYSSCFNSLHATYFIRGIIKLFHKNNCFSYNIFVILHNS